MDLNERDLQFIGSMKLACCALHPECTARDFCNKTIKKIGAENKGSLVLSAWTFDRAKRAFMDGQQGNGVEKIEP